MEFLRFGSSIPGSYWGCCACDIIQNFKVDPDDKASIEIVDGDGGVTQGVFAGPTWKDIFHQRIRFGTFSTRDMPNHAFFAILTEWQINSSVGKKWLEILRETGFEFIRTVNNSVYSGESLGKPTADVNNNDNHIFALIRNIGANALRDPFTPPKAWTDLSSKADEAWSYLPEGVIPRLVENQHKDHTAIWNEIGPAKLMTKEQVKAAGAPVILAGIRPAGVAGALQEPEEERLKRAEKAGAKAKQNSLTGAPLAV